ncbi:MFS transporter [Streptomyces brevispora]|uniref:MFS transporter n=1 Tax=Streptomyces brevispora TaxID=887462 RepID=A0A561UU72_9ACTN|nr:MFS transporter [Streptomyces brevispora]TWG02911.1 MFS transporter [Streptomyces brevispora]
MPEPTDPAAQAEPAEQDDPATGADPATRAEPAEKPSWRDRLTSAMPATRESRIIAVNALVGSMGTGMFLAGSALYFTRFAGLTATQLGVGLGIAGIMGIATTVPMGMLADRFGPRNVLLVVCIWRAIGYIAYLRVEGFTQFVFTACVLYIMDRAGQPLNQALVGRLITGTERNRTMGFIRSLRNLGFTVGFSLAGIALTTGSKTGFQLLFVGNAISFLFVFALITMLPKVGRTVVKDTGDAKDAKPLVPPSRDWRFVAATAANGVLFLHDAILITVLPLWVAEHTRSPIWMITVLVTTNTVITVVAQVRATRHINSLSSATRATTQSSVLLLFACVAFAVSGVVDTPAWAIVALTVALLLLTFGELLHSASSWEISFALSPEAAQGRYLAFFNVGFSAAEIAGPAVVLWLLTRTGPGGWLILAVCFPLSAALSWVGTREKPAVPEQAVQDPDPVPAAGGS